MREKVSFETNVPETVILQFDDGTLVPGKSGDQYQYFLKGNRIMWVDPVVRDAIYATGARADDEVIITKTERRNGTKRNVMWAAEKRQEMPPEAQAESARAWADVPQHPDTAPTPAARPPAAAPSKTNGNGHSQAAAPAPAAAPIASPAADDTPEHAPYFRAFKLALDTARDVEAYAATIGRAVAFTSEDLRAMAATLFMGARR